MDDEHAEDDFEASLDDAAATGSGSAAAGCGGGGDGDAPEEEVRPPASPAPASAADETETKGEAPRQHSQALRDALAVNDDMMFASGGEQSSPGSDGEDSHGSHGRLKRKNRSASRMRVSGRHLLDNSLWTFSICATRIRSLQVPFATRPTAAPACGRGAFPPAIRELRVFATLDKQSMQSQGSDWKREPRPETRKSQKNLRDRVKRAAAGAAGRASPDRRSSASPSSSSSLLGRRSGFLDEASWRGVDGTLRWTFSMEKFRKLKVSTPRVKVLVFGIGENAVDANVRKLSEESAHTHNESIVSFGWFFLDLRTPDLPGKWFKLQNSRFGGEILISTAFVPFGHQQQQQATGISPPIKAQGRLTPADHQRKSNVDDQQQQRQQPTSVPTPIPKAVEDGEYLRLGSRQGMDIFVISVFLQAAFNLAEVVEMTLGSRKTASESYRGGFWLSYSLFDVVVRTDVFHNLDVSEFPPIRDSFRVVSCLQDLADFFVQQSFAVYLCTYNRVLAGVEIPSGDLLTGELFSKTKQQQQQQPIVGLQAVVEGNFAFPSTNGPSIDASIAVECVRTASKSADVDAKKVSIVPQPEATHQLEPVRETVDASPVIVQDQVRDEGEEKGEEQPVVPTIRVCVDQIRLDTDAVSGLAGEEGISLELSIGSAKSAGAVRFHSFMTDRVLGDNDAVQLLLNSLSFEELQRSRITVRCFSSESRRQVGKSQSITQRSDRWESVEDIPGTPFCIVSAIHSTSDNAVVGRRTLRLEAHDQADHDELVSQACSAREEVRLFDAFTSPVAPPTISAKASAEKRMASTVETLQHEANSARDRRNASSAQSQDGGSTETQNRQQVVDDHGEEARAREISLLKKSLECEKQLWIQEQQSERLQWKRRLEAMERARMNELEEEWARREEERSSLLRTTQAEYERLEKALRTSLLELEARERRLAIAENALQRDQQNQKDENEHFRKRLQSDHTHALSIAQKQSEAQEKRNLMLEKQLSDAEKRARQVEADFAEYRLQQRKVPESRLREEISALKGSIFELEKQKMHVEKERDAVEANCGDLRLQLEKLAKLVQNEKKKNEVRVVEELEKLRVKFVAREEKYVLDGDREELRAIKKQLDELKGLNLCGSAGCDCDYDPVTTPQGQEQHQQQHSPAKQRTRRSEYQTGDSGHHRRHQHRHASMHRTRSHVQPLHPAQRQVPRGSISSISNSNWDSQFSSIDQHHRHRQQQHRHQSFPGDSLPPDEGVKSLNGSTRSSQHYEHEDDADESGEEEDMDDGDFDRYSDPVENENQLHNANHHRHHLNELDRLERERKLLLASGAYDEQSYLVRELTRLIEVTRTREEATARQRDPLLY